MGSGLSQEDLEEKNVVIIGGGFAGTQLASNLANKGIPFVLIDPKEYFHYSVGALRAAVFPGESYKIYKIAESISSKISTRSTTLKQIVQIDEMNKLTE